MSTLSEFIKSTSIGELLPSSSEVYFCYESDPLVKAIDLLLDKKIQSIPLRNAKTGKFTSFLDLLDVVHFSLKYMKNNEIERGKPQGYLALVQASTVFETTTCADLIVKGQPTGHSFVETSPNTHIRDILAAMVHSNFSYQRVPVLDEKGAVLGIVSQSRIIRECGKHLGKSALAASAVGDTFKSQLKPVFVVESSQTVSEALDLIQSRRVSAVGIVDGSGKLVGNFSASDVKRYTLDLSHIIAQTLSEFIESVDKTDFVAYPVAVQKSTTVEELFAKFDLTGVHRVYVVDDFAKPVGLISAKDLVRFLLSVADGVPIESADEDAALRQSKNIESAEESESSTKGKHHHSHHHHHHHHHHHNEHKK